MGNDKVVQIVPALLQGGLETLAYDLYSKSSMQHWLLSLQFDAKKTFAIFPELKTAAEYCHFVNKSEGLSWQVVKNIRTFLNNVSPQVIHTHNEGPLFYGTIAGRLAKKPRHIHTFHDTWNLLDWRERLYAKLMLKISKPIVVVPAKPLIADVKAVFPKATVTAINNGVDVNKFNQGDKELARAQLKLPPKAKLIGCAARLELEKGHKYLLIALAKLDPDIELVFAGKGAEQANLNDLAKELGLAQRVHFLNFVSDMSTFYNAIDVFCLASLLEGLPLAPLEAQACGVPAVVTDVGSSALTVDANTGLVVPAKDPNALAVALVSILDREQQNSPREYVVENFNIETTVKRYEALYLGLE